MSKQTTDFKVILPLLFVVFIDSMGMGIIFPILTPVFMSPDGILPAATTLTTRSLYYGITMCAFPFAMFFGTPILGDLSDFIGRKRILLICLLGVAVSYFLSGIAIIINSIALLIISRIIAGLFAGSVATAQAAVIDISPSDKKAAYLSYLLFPTAIGFVAGPLLGGFTSSHNLVSWFGLWTPLAIAAILATLNIFYLLWAFKETHVVKSGFVFKWHHGIQIFADAFRNKDIRLLSVIYLCLQLGWSLYFQYISIFLVRRFHYSAFHIGLFMAVIGMGFSITLLLLVNIITKYIKPKPIVLHSLIISAVCLFVTATTYQINLLWIVGFILAIGMSLAYPVMITMYSNMISPEKQGWIMGVADAVVGIAWAITAFAGSFMQSLTVNFAMLLAGVFMAIAAVLTLFYREKN